MGDHDPIAAAAIDAMIARDSIAARIRELERERDEARAALARVRAFLRDLHAALAEAGRVGVHENPVSMKGE